MPSPIGTAYVEVVFDDAQVRRQLHKLNSDIDQTAASTKGIGEQSKRSMGQVEESTGKARKGFGLLGKSVATTAGLFGAGLGVAAAVDGFKGAVDAASDLNEQVNKSGAVFGKQGKAVIAWSKGLDDSFGVSQRAALESAGVFGNMLRPMGVGAKQAANMSKRMVQLGGDMASFNNASPEETLDAIRAGLAGETEPLRKYGVSINAARIQNQALRMGLVKMSVDQTKVKIATGKLVEAQKAAAAAAKEHGKGSDAFRKAQLEVEAAQDRVAKATKGTVPQLTAAQKAQATYALILKDTKSAQGDFEKTSGGVANQQRIMSARWEDLQAKIGQKFLPIVQKAQGAIIDLLAWFSKSGPFFDGLVAKWRELTAKGTPLRQAFDTIGKAISGLGPTIDDVKAIVRDLMPVFQRAAQYAAAQFKNVATIFSGVVTVIKGVVKIIRGLLEGDWSMVWAGAKQVVSGLVTAVKGILGGLKTAVQEEIAVIGVVAAKLGGAIVDGIVAGIKGAYGLLTRAVSSLKDTVVNAVKGAATWLVGIGQNIVRGLMRGIRDLASRELRGMTVIKNAVVGAVTGSVTWLVDTGKNVITGLIAGLRANSGQVKDYLLNLMKGAKDAVLGFFGISSPSRVFHQIGVDLIAGLVGGIKVTTPAAVAAVRALAKKTVDAAKTSLSVASGALGDQLTRAFQAKQDQRPKTQAQKDLEAFQAVGAPSDDSLTAAEKQLKALADQRDEAARQRALTDANAAVASAQTADEQLAAQQQLADAEYAITVAGLEKTAEKERAQRDTDNAARQAQYEKELADKQAAADAANLIDETVAALHEQHFQADLAALQRYVESGKATAEGARKRIAAIQKTYVIDLGFIGKTLGQEFAKGVENSSDDVAQATGRFSAQVAVAAAAVRDAQKILDVINARRKRKRHPGGSSGSSGSSRSSSLYAGLAAPLAAGGDATSGLAGPLTPGLQISRLLSSIPAAEAAPTVVGVRVFIGEQELRGIVRTEVETVDNRTAASLLAGVR